MNIFILNKELERIGVIDTYTSVIWTNRYYECGDFELYMCVNEKVLNKIKIDYMLIREDKEENAMIIEKIELSTDDENGNYITVTGRCLKSILYRRIVWNQTSLNGKIEYCISRLITENAIKAELAERNISNLIIGELIDTAFTINAQYTGDNLGESIVAICQNYGIGWDIKLDLENAKFVFVLYKGADRSYGQELNPWIVFANEYENLLTTNSSYNKENYKNVAKVAGEGEGTFRKFTIVGQATGIDRRETFVDARDLSTNEGTTSEEEYYIQLQERGKEKLAESTIETTFEGETVDYTYKFEKDYFLGDIVEVVNEYGLGAATRITEVIESEDESGKYTIPTFFSE